MRRRLLRHATHDPQLQLFHVKQYERTSWSRCGCKQEAPNTRPQRDQRGLSQRVAKPKGGRPPRTSTRGTQFGPRISRRPYREESSEERQLRRLKPHSTRRQRGKRPIFDFPPDLAARGTTFAPHARAPSSGSKLSTPSRRRRLPGSNIPPGLDATHLRRQFSRRGVRPDQPSTAETKSKAVRNFERRQNDYLACPQSSSPSSPPTGFSHSLS